MKYQIKSKNVKEYIDLVKNKLDTIEALIKDKQDYMNTKLIWNSDTGTDAKKIYQVELNKQIAYCNSIKMFLEIYEKGLAGFETTFEEIKKKFIELQEENNILIKGDIYEIER